MLETRIIPCLLADRRRLVKTIQFRNPRYVGDPINVVKILNDKEVDELIMLDITTDCAKPDFEFVETFVSECFMPVSYGGAISKIEDAARLFSIGIEKVCLNTHAIKNPSLVASLAEKFGSQSVVVSMDAKKGLLGRYELYSHGGRKRTGLDPVSFARAMERAGAGEILINAIHRDGTLKGYDIELIRAVSTSVGIPVVACGGAGALEHFSEAVVKGAASAAAAGSYFIFHGKHQAVLINYPERSILKALFPR